jgi:hypothetical protein
LDLSPINARDFSDVFRSSMFSPTVEYWQGHRL